MPIMCLEGGFLYILQLHKDLMVPGFQIQFIEIEGAIEFIEQLFNYRNWKVVQDYDFIKGIVNTQSP